MGIINGLFAKKETRSSEGISSNTNMASFGGTSVNGEVADVVVNEKSILKIPTVNACLELICGTIAQLPVYLYRQENDGTVRKIEGDNRTFLLNNEANENLTAFDYKKICVKDHLIQGASYSFIEKVGNEINGLYPLKAKDVTVDKYYENSYKFRAEISSVIDGKTFDFDILDILAICRNTEDGVIGKGLLEEGEDIFKLALNEMLYSSNVLSKGVLPIGVLETEGKIGNEKTLARLKDSLKTLYGGAKNAGKTLILEEGLTYKSISLSPNDLNLNDSKKNSQEEICKLFNVPASLVLSNGGYGNVEQDNLHFLKYCLQQIMTSMENGFDKMLLLEDEKMQGFYFRFDSSEIVRTTEKEKYEAIEKGMKSGVISINEARAKLDFDPIDEDYMMFSLGNIFYNKETKKFIVPNTGQGIEDDKGVANNADSGDDNSDDSIDD
ncbi:phage portal protein [uncultured Clostridium sp.]|uniref:phage portal protein n=1 Tax=uncultured Clostridium sp. TaxID=59620 RepID=UPI0025CC6337|nr:phage portal protein [uncultured Clostridium sp.]